MKKICSLCLCVALIFTAMPPVRVAAYTPPTRVRIGLESKYKQTDSVPITNTALSVGFEMGGRFFSYGTLWSNGGFTVKPVYDACVRGPSRYATYDQALSAANAFSNNYAPALADNGEWWVYGVSFSSETDARNAANALGGTFLTASTKRVALYSGGKAVAILDNEYNAAQYMDANGGFLSVGGVSYRGILECARNTSRGLTAVNVLTLDEYLYSIVPIEMSSAFHIEALKAQAVASRSYLLTRAGTHTGLGYDLCDQSHCQPYYGTEKEHESATRAVNETSGRVVTYAGQLANTVYFSSSGGTTDDSAHVWLEAVSYLRSVNEIGEYEPKVWTRSFTLSELTALLTANGVSIGSATGVSITRVSASGRVQELTIHGTSGVKTLTKEEIRTFFASSTGGSLESRNFTIENGTLNYTANTVTVTDGTQTKTFPVTSMYGFSSDGTVIPLDAPVAYDGTNTVSSGSTVVSSGGSGVVFAGRGWGHGVGMSQRGAEGMARMGYDYIAILKHYYTGVTIE